jgi:hypothetical protein
MRAKKILSILQLLFLGVAAYSQSYPVNDDVLNTVQVTTYDGTVNEIVVGEIKSYYDLNGRIAQVQVKNLSSNKILASQDLYDKYDRIVGSSLAAPISSTAFTFEPKFLSGDNSIPGRLLWYYGSNNTLELLTPKTLYPYSNTEFYNDGTGEVKKSASPGNQHRLGTGREVLSGTFPVLDELDDYLTKRPVAIAGIAQDGSLFNEGVQSVTRDQNGKYTISIADKAGNVVMTAQKGTDQDYSLRVDNSISIDNRDITSLAYRQMTYFYILDAQVVNFSLPSGFIIEDILSNVQYTSTTSVPKTSDNKWLPGFYRVFNVPGILSIQYTNYYKDVSYQFYDDAGRLRSSVSPNGCKAWLSTPAAKYSDIDKTTYSYDHRGSLIEMNEPDAATTKYLYRKDGKIRFSQNAEQAIPSRNDFSYTIYDQIGRPIESGEYIGAAHTYSTINGQLEYDQQVTFAPNDVKDWIKTYYDYPETTIPNLPTSLTQTFVRNAVSWTENSNSKTWYSYDEMGRVVWRAQKPSALNFTFLTQYSYDFLGNVLTVKNSRYSGQNEIQPFFHHYEHNLDKRLSKVFTSLDGSTKRLRATYSYYLHGPLKRIELGDQIQGIDFVYNIQGWLTQINHPDKLQDPGHDTNDVFGMVLDYYESSLPGLLSMSSVITPNAFHGIPFTNDVQPPTHKGLERNRLSTIMSDK